MRCRVVGDMAGMQALLQILRDGDISIALYYAMNYACDCCMHIAHFSETKRRAASAQPINLGDSRTVSDANSDDVGGALADALLDVYSGASALVASTS